MDAQTYAKIRAFCARTLIPKLHDELDDAAQEVALGTLIRPSATWRQLLIDWLRSNGYGSRGLLGMKVMTERSDADVEKVAATWCAPKGVDHTHLSPRESRVLHLLSRGYLLKEIGALEGVSESRISQILKATLGKARAQREQEDFLGSIVPRIPDESVRRYLVRKVKTGGFGVF